MPFDLRNTILIKRGKNGKKSTLYVTRDQFERLKSSSELLDSFAIQIVFDGEHFCEEDVNNFPAKFIDGVTYGLLSPYSQ